MYVVFLCTDTVSFFLRPLELLVALSTSRRYDFADCSVPTIDCRADLSMSIFISFPGICNMSVKKPDLIRGDAALRGEEIGV
mmetsp:Transcript_27887/g.28160  ORF Transcript_27887/g.28160 Transcript_27887/m.28160 type:complete len:82 (-) Transcript_27887:49-294(-)